MKFNTKVILVNSAVVVLILLLFSIFIFPKYNQVREQTGGEFSGILRLDGSTTVFPVAKKAADVFMKNHPGVAVIVYQSSSGEGYDKFLMGETDISDATRAPNEEEYARAASKGIDLYMTVIANDGVAVITHRDNPLRDISLDELNKIFFTAEINDWSQIVSNRAGKINVYGTDPEISGTADLFISRVNPGGKFVGDYHIVYPTPHIVASVAADPNAIAFTPLKWVDSSVNLLAIEGVIPSTQSILDRSDPFARRMLMVTDGRPKGLAREFINFILSNDGQNIVEGEGFVPVIR